MTKRLKFGLVGFNVQHSRSPEIFRTIFDLTGLDGEFDIYDVSPKELEGALQALRGNGVDALSITTPYKLTFADCCDSLDETARAIGAVNSVKIDGKTLIGYNTDCHGFAAPLHEHADRLSQADVLILGTGGAARAVLYSLVNTFNIRSVTLVSRKESSLESFRSAMAPLLGSCDLKSVTTSELSLMRDLMSFELLANCTPVGSGHLAAMNPWSEEFAWPQGKIYYDLNYGDHIPALEAAEGAGLVAIDGRRMLVAQALKSMELWTGRVVSFEPVFERVFG